MTVLMRTAARFSRRTAFKNHPFEHNIEFHPSSSNSLESDEVEMPLPTAVVVAELVILSCNGAQVKM